MIAQQLGANWGQNFVIDNRAGASGIIGTELAAKAVPDGYTLLLGTTGTHTTNPAVFKKLPYDPLGSFAPVTNLVDTPFMLVAHLSMPATSVSELVQLARSKPRDFSYASFGNGSSAHLVGELFKIIAKIDLTHIPYKGGPSAMTDLLGGHVTMMFNSLPRCGTTYQGRPFARLRDREHATCAQRAGYSDIRRSRFCGSRRRIVVWPVRPRRYVSAYY
jgi:tripartite-type tricarboxylate transporter receptor subunit TctC